MKKGKGNDEIMNERNKYHAEATCFLLFLVMSGSSD
jgi:hypothetical protein